MRMEQLEQIQAIAESGSINRAAKALYLSQSNLSQSLRSLEQEIGVALFSRTARGVELTPFGCEFLALARSVNSQVRLLEEFCAQTRQKPALRFSVASQYMRFTHSLFLELYEQNRDSRNNFSFFECSLLDIVEHVASQRAELGIILLSLSQRKLTLQLIKSRGLIYHPIATYPASITIGPKNPFYNTNAGSVTMEDMAPFPVVLYRGTNYNYTSEMEEFGINDKKNQVYVSDRATMHEFIRNTDAFSIAAYTGAYSNTEYYDRIRALKLSDRRISLELGYVESQSRPLSPLAREYALRVEELLSNTETNI